MRYVSLGSSYFSWMLYVTFASGTGEWSPAMAYCVVTAVQAEPVSAEGEGALVTFAVDEVSVG